MWYWDEEILDTEEGEIRRLSVARMLGRMLPLLRPHLGALACGILLLLVTVAAEIGGPLVLRYLIDHDITGGDRAGIVRSAVAYALIFIVGMGAGYLQVIVTTRMGLRIVTRLKNRMFKHLFTLSLAYFDKNPPGRLMARVESDAERLQMLFSEVAIGLFRSLVLLVGVLVVMLIADARVTASVLAMGVPLCLGTFYFLTYLRGIYRRIRKLYARISTFLTEYVQGIPILQVYGHIEQARLKLRRRNLDKYRVQTGAMFFEYGLWSVLWTLEVAAVMVIIWVGSRQVFGTGMTVGTLVLFLEYTRRLFFPIVMFSEQVSFIQRALASADRVFAVLDTPSKTPDYPGARETVPDDWQQLAFENVSFSYDGGQKALDGLSFVVNRGERIALAGESGGGKTTVTNLLLRYYEPTEGKITLDGVDIKGYRQRAWREKIGLVLQDIHLFPGSVGENLRALADDISPEAVEQAVRTVQAEKVIERLSEGYETELAEGGANLSMGERQLISFGRAVVRDPDILVLDEATASVDPATEREIQAALARLFEGRTSIVVAHRLATIVSADRILVLHRGKLVEEGDHEELYERNGIYRALFDLQFKSGEIA